MVTRNRLIYSAAATARLLQRACRQVKRVEEFAYTVWVWVAGCRPTFVGKAAYKREFVDFRKRAAKALRVLGYEPSRFGIAYQVTGNSERSYLVEVQHDGTIACTCEDMANQVERFGRGACKHIYALLQHLGHESLADFIQARARSEAEWQLARRSRPQARGGVAIE